MNPTKMQQAIADIQSGKMVIIVDDHQRENEGDLVIAAEKVTPESINFMAHHGCGLICMPMSDDYFDRLDIPMMVKDNQSAYQTAFGVSIGSASGVTTGISAHDRAHTIRVAADLNSTAKDIVKPGHIFPLKAVKGGVLKRKGHTEASTDLAAMAGFNRAAVICEIMNTDGSMARQKDLLAFAKKHSLTIISVEEIVEYRLQTEMLVEKMASARLPTKFGEMQIHHFRSELDTQEWIAISSGDIHSQSAPLVRLHSQCLTGDVFGSLRCDCGEQLDKSMREIAREGGIVIYLPQEGRNIGLMNKIKSYALQDNGLDTVQANHALGFPADAREYVMAAHILKSFGVHAMQLMTNNPCKIEAMEHYGIAVTKRVPVIASPRQENEFYLTTKKRKMGHLINI